MNTYASVHMSDKTQVKTKHNTNFDSIELSCKGEGGEVNIFIQNEEEVDMLIDALQQSRYYERSPSINGEIHEVLHMDIEPEEKLDQIEALLLEDAQRTNPKPLDLQEDEQ